MWLEVLMQYSGIISQKLSPLVRRFRDILIIIITNFVIVLSVGIKRVDCKTLIIIICYKRNKQALTIHVAPDKRNSQKNICL